MSACADCRRRSAALALLSPYLEHARHERRRIADALSLPDETLARAVGGRRAEALAGQTSALGPAEGPAICRHSAEFPPRLLDDRTVRNLFVHGERARLTALTSTAVPAVSIVGTRRASPEGLRTARELGRGLAAAGVTVVSGMALGVDSAAHEGALEGGGATIAVLAGGPDVAYPPSKAPLHRRIAAQGVVVSEMPPGVRARKWSFPARNRIIAALGQATIVVEAAQRSGSLITAEFALELGREVLAVPGSVRSWRSDGTNALIRDGASLVRDARDVLDSVLGPELAVGVRFVAPPPELDEQARALLKAIEGGSEDTERLCAGVADGAGLLGRLAELELLGLIRLLPGGRIDRTRA